MNMTHEFIKRILADAGRPMAGGAMVVLILAWLVLRRVLR